MAKNYKEQEVELAAELAAVEAEDKADTTTGNVLPEDNAHSVAGDRLPGDFVPVPQNVPYPADGVPRNPNVAYPANGVPVTQRTVVEPLTSVEESAGPGNASSELPTTKVEPVLASPVKADDPYFVNSDGIKGYFNAEGVALPVNGEEVDVGQEDQNIGKTADQILKNTVPPTTFSHPTGWVINPKNGLPMDPAARPFTPNPGFTHTPNQ